MLHSIVQSLSTSCLPNREFKKVLAKKLITFQYSDPDSENMIDLKYHGIPLRLFLNDLIFLKELKEYFPTSWRRCSLEPALTVKFIDAGVFEKKGLIWEDEEDSELFMFSNGPYDLAVQRDFIGIKHENKKTATIVARSRLADGFFNAMRWLLPQYFLKNTSLVLHSSCVILKNKKAAVFLGPSGAGKSTVAAKANHYLVLGDDVSFITLEKEEVLIQTCALGQDTAYEGPLENKFPVLGFFFLKKSAEEKLTKMTKAKAQTKFLGSIFYPQWKGTSCKEGESILKLSETFIEKIPCYEWEFCLNTNLKEMLDGFE